MEAWQMHEWFAEYLQACNRHDLEAVRGFVDPEVRRAHLPGGAEAYVDDLAELLHGFPDWQWRSIQVVVEDDRLAAHLRGSGTHTGPYGGVAPTRRRVNVAEFVMYRVARGRIVAATGSGDAELRAQLSG